MDQAAAGRTAISPAEQPAAIAKLVVGLTAEYTGRGPTKAQAVVQGDVVTVILEDTLTKGERSLVRDGQTDTVVALRRAFQAAMGRALTAGVEAITGRQVRAVLSDHHVDLDIAVECFLLKPQREG